MTPAITLIIGLQFIGLVFFVADNLLLRKTLHRIFRDKLAADDAARTARLKLAALQSTIHSSCSSPSSK